MVELIVESHFTHSILCLLFACLQILWRAVVDNSVNGGSVDVYTGTAQTFMSFKFVRSAEYPYIPTVELASGGNILSNTIDWCVNHIT